MGLNRNPRNAFTQCVYLSKSFRAASSAIAYAVGNVGNANLQSLKFDIRHGNVA